MILQSLTLTNWRRHESLTIDFHPRTNLIVADNDRGKTSLLKAIAYALWPNGRIGDASDIRTGAEEAVVTLKIGVPAQNGYQSHTITRWVDRKKKTGIEIDGDKVTGARAIEIMTEQWGLPHPEQLVGMIWLRQFTMNTLVMEEPQARQERYGRLLGYQSLKRFAAPLERIISGLSTSATTERSRGVDPRELESEIENSKTQLELHRQDIARLLPPEKTRELEAALRGFIARTEAATARAEADLAAGVIPPEFQPWLAVCKENIRNQAAPKAPSLTRLADVARFESELTQVNQELKKKTSIDFIKRAKAAIKRLTLQIRFAAARIAADAADQALPTELLPWKTEYLRNLQDATAPKAPSINALATIGSTQAAIEVVKVQIAKITPSEADAPVAERAIKRRSAALEVAQAEAALDRALVPLPAALKDWANRLNDLYSKTRALSPAERTAAFASAEVPSPQSLIDANDRAAQDIAHNETLATLKANLAALVGENMPDSAARAQLARWVDTKRELHGMADKYGLSRNACNGSGPILRAAVESQPRALLARELPAFTAPENSTALSAQAEEALKLVWSDLEKAKGQVKRCPLSDDVLTPAAIKAAQAAQQKRLEDSTRGAQWHTFVNKLATKDRELATLVVDKQFGKLVETLKTAATAYETAIAQHLAPETSTFWTAPVAQREFFALHERATALETGFSPENRQWLITNARRTERSMSDYLAAVSAAEDAIHKHGPARELKAGTFPRELNGAIYQANDAIVVVDQKHTALATLGQFTEEDRALLGRLGYTVASPADATKLLTNLATTAKTRETLLTQQRLLESQLKQAVTDSHLDEARLSAYAQLIARFQQYPAFKNGIDPLVEAYVNAMQKAATLGAEARNDEFTSADRETIQVTGSVPATEAEASALSERLSTEETQIVTLATESEMLTKQLRQARADLALSEGEYASYARLMTALRDDPAYKTAAGTAVPAFTAKEQRAQTLAASASSAPEWDSRLGPAPANLDVANARLATLEAQVRDYASLAGKIETATGNLTRLELRLTQVLERQSLVNVIDARQDLFKAVEKFLQPEEGPRVLMSQQFIDIVNRANEILDGIGAPCWLIGNEEFELFQDGPDKGPDKPPASETGGGNGYIIGIALAQALLEHYNDTAGRAGVHTLLLDEPTICVNPKLIPSLMNTISSHGRRTGMQTIVIEHNPNSESTADNVIRIAA